MISVLGNKVLHHFTVTKWSTISRSQSGPQFYSHKVVHNFTVTKWSTISRSQSGPQFHGHNTQFQPAREICTPENKSRVWTQAMKPLALEGVITCRTLPCGVLCFIYCRSLSGNVTSNDLANESKWWLGGYLGT